MSYGLCVGPSQILLFGEPEAGHIPLNLVYLDLVYFDLDVCPKNKREVAFYSLLYKFAAFCWNEAWLNPFQKSSRPSRQPRDQ
jgi:hypothetical protein